MSDPQRTCAGCGSSRRKEDLVRIVAGPDGRAVPDLKGNLPGRGAYVCHAAACVRRAANGRLAAALKAPGLQPPDPEGLRGAIVDGLRARALGLMGLAQRSRRLVSGASLVRGELGRGAQPGWSAIVAEDASEPVAAAALRRLEAAGLAAQRIFTRDQIGSAIGKGPRSVVLIKDRDLAAALARTAERIRQFQIDGGSCDERRSGG